MGNQKAAPISTEKDDTTPNRRSTRRRHAAAGAVWINLSAIFVALAVNSSLPISLFLMIAALLAAWGAARQLQRPGGNVVLVYHSVSNDQAWLPWSDQIAVTPDTLRSQLTFLKRLGFTFLSTHEHHALRQNPGAASHKMIVVHFDDGYLDNWVAAAPILRRLEIPATIFISLDFVEPGADCRLTLEQCWQGDVAPTSLEWRGYMNWAEIAALTTSSLIDIQPHGVDHGRVPISNDVLSKVSEANWRQHAWLQWRHMGGNAKSGWWRFSSPPVVPIGTPIPISAPALSSPAWLGDRHESMAEFEQRVRSQLSACKETFLTRLGKTADIFCWPENATTEVARRIAAELGFLATTAGSGENRLHEDPAVISRLHVGDRTLGFRCKRADLLYLYASIRCFQGFYYWYYLLLITHGIRHIVAKASRGRFARYSADACTNSKMYS